VFIVSHLTVICGRIAKFLFGKPTPQVRNEERRRRGFRGQYGLLEPLMIQHPDLVPFTVGGPVPDGLRSGKAFGEKIDARSRDDRMR
jgi:hypothetical protein